MTTSTVFRSAIAMNNMAATLLKRRSYEDAHIVFNSVLHSFRICSLIREQQTDLQLQQTNDPSTLKTEDQFIFEYETKVQDMFQYAEHRLCLVSSTEPKYNNSGLIVEPTYINELNCCDTLEAIVSSQSRSTDCLRLYPICIDLKNEATDTSIHMECAILFYNCALAHCCLWYEDTFSASDDTKSTTYSIQSRKNHYDSAIELLIMGHNFCSDEIGQLIGDEKLWSGQLAGYVFIESCILSTIILLLREYSPSTTSSKDCIKRSQNFYLQLEILLAGAKDASIRDIQLFGNTNNLSAPTA